MNHNSTKNCAGVWLDSQHAIILAHTPDTENGDYSVQEKVAAPKHHGGKSEHTSNNADQGNNLKYFKAVSQFLLKYDEILVFGPGKSQEQFVNFMNEDAHFQNKKITLDSAKHLTDPQMIAKVTDFFNSN